MLPFHVLGRECCSDPKTICDKGLLRLGDGWVVGVHMCGGLLVMHVNIKCWEVKMIFGRHSLLIPISVFFRPLVNLYGLSGVGW